MLAVFRLRSSARCQNSRLSVLPGNMARSFCDWWRKKQAIFRHQSQKDRAMFPGGTDRREFWQRAEDRNLGTARTYDALGLPEYYALEAFVKWKDA